MREGHKPLEVIHEAVKLGIDSVIVGVSGGRDSVATLDLCVKHFRTVRAYFMYIVPGIQFQERYLQMLERRYKVEIVRVPHFTLPRIMSQGVFRHKTKSTGALRKCRQHHLYAYIRQQLGLHWIALGEKASDSLQRNTQMAQRGGVQTQRGTIMPLAWWSNSDVESYVSSLRIPLAPDYALAASAPDALRRSRSGSFSSLLRIDALIQIRERYPDDYERIKRMFPLVDAHIIRYNSLRERGLIDVEKAAGSEVCKQVAERRRAELSLANQQRQHQGQESDGEEEVR